MKLGRTFPAVRRALAAAGRLDHAMYVERASHTQQRWMQVADVGEAEVHYLSLIVVNGDSINGPRSRVVVEEHSLATVSTDTGIAELLVDRVGTRTGRLDDAGGDGRAGRSAARGRLWYRMWQECHSEKVCSGTHLATQ